MYTIYIKQSSIRILPEGEESINDSVSDGKNTVLKSSKGFPIAGILESIKEMLVSEEVKTLEIRCSHPKNILKEIKESMKYIKAAGGLVRNEKKEYLFIFRLGKWDLPKGKLEEGEDIEDCGKREVEEECGVRIALIKKELPSTYHIYEMGDKLVLKRTYWFLMKAREGDSLKPQTEEGISEVCWVNKADFGRIRENTYPSVLDVLKTIPE